MRNPSVFLLLALLICLDAAAAAQPLTLEETVSLKRVTAVRMSPSGEAIAYLLSVPRTPYVDEDGEAWVELHVVDLEANSRPYVGGEIEVKSVAWAADGRSLFFAALRDKEDKFDGLWQIPLAGGEAVKRYQHVNKIEQIYPSPDGRHVAFIAKDAPPPKKEELAKKGFRAAVYEESKQSGRVWLLDLETGKALPQDLRGHASALEWSPDGKRYAVVLAPTPLIDDSYTSRKIHVVDAASGRIEGRLRSAGKLGAFAWSPDGRNIAYVGSEDINDPSEGRVFVSAAVGGDRRELLPGYPGHVKDVGWADANTVRYIGHRGLWSAYSSVLVASPASETPAPEAGPILRSFDDNPGQDAVAAIADTPLHPAEVYLLRENETPVRLTDSNPWLAERTLGSQETLTYEARDGLKLEAVLIRPIGRQTSMRHPLIVFVHGGPESHYSNGWMSGYSRPAHALAAQGYAIVYPNYRGSTGRGVEFSKLSQNDYAEEEFNDVVDAKNAVVKTGLADSDRVGVSGGSYGGYASMWAASALSEHFAAAVAFVGISNQTSKFGTGDIPYEMFHVHSRQWPWEDWMWMLKRSPIYHADKTKTPLLIMAGDKDPRVHPSQSLEMYRHVKLRTQTPVRLVWYPDEKHGNKRSAAQLDYALRLERWMNHFVRDKATELPPWEIDHASELESRTSALVHEAKRTTLTPARRPSIPAAVSP